jgi:hypothetical protein
MTNMVSMFTSYNLSSKVVVLAFNVCVCNVYNARTIDSSRFGIQHFKIKMSLDAHCSLLNFDATSWIVRYCII